MKEISRNHIFSESLDGALHRLADGTLVRKRHGMTEGMACLPVPDGNPVDNHAHVGVGDTWRLLHADDFGKENWYPFPWGEGDQEKLFANPEYQVPVHEVGHILINILDYPDGTLCPADPAEKTVMIYQCMREGKSPEQETIYYYAWTNEIQKIRKGIKKADGGERW